MAQVRVRKRGKTFSYIFEAGKIDGKRKVVEKGGYPTKAEAYKAGVAAYNDFLHGNIGITSESISLKDFMTAWLDNVIAANVKMSSMQTYRTFFNNQIVPYLGEVKVQDLTPAMLDKWIRDIQKAGLSYNTISSVHAFIHNALNYAVYPAQLINSNPAAYIKVPKNAPKNIVKRHIITPERFKALLEKYPFETPYYMPLLLLYHTGMRIGEVLGLSWSDIDFAKKRITLRRQIRYIAKRGHFFMTLKTKSSERYIIISDILLSELRRWQNQQAENEKQFGDSYVYVYREENGHIQRQSKGLPVPVGEKISLVCTRDNGQLVLANHLAAILRSEDLNAHSFRHTHATQLIENGAAPKGVAGRLGHANTQITQNLYTHNTLKLQEETAAIFNKNLQTNS
ncbi:MAG: site-specific integrase [Clostridia bacterium]|nr:site-specific integrase [Clostridia bacterium]